MAFGSAMNSAHVDALQERSVIGVIGTLGTADSGGTALTLPIGVDPTTGAMYVNNLGASSSGTNVNIVTGTQQTLGTVGVVNSIVTGTLGTILGIGGTVAVSGASTGTNVNIVTGTLNSGTIAITTGTIVGPVSSGGSETGAPVPVGGTDSGGTVRLPLVTSGGVLAANIPTGTLTTGSLSNVAMLNAGTITTLPNIPGGTLGVVSAVSVLNAGTITTLPAISLTSSGTILNLAAGTLNALASGTITAGTVRRDFYPIQVGTSYGTLGTTGAAVWGTLVAGAGAGTYVYLDGLSIVVASGTVDCAITTNVAGSVGNGVFARGQFVPGGGITRDYPYSQKVGTNGTIAFWMGGAGTAIFTVNYWVGT